MLKFIRKVATIRKQDTLKKLIETLRERNISRLQLAMRAGISPSDLYAVLSGKKFLHPGWRRKIAEYLQMDERDLFGTDGGKND